MRPPTAQPALSNLLLALAALVIAGEMVGLAANLRAVTVNRFAAPVTRNAPRPSDISLASITTIAGTGEYGLDGDSGRGNRAVLARPTGVAISPGGEIVISDTGNRRLRVLRGDGTIDTLSLAQMITKVACLAPLPQDCASVQPGPPGTSYWRAFAEPRGIGYDGRGNLYVADAGENRVWTVTRTGIITHAWGTGNAGYAGDGGEIDRSRFLHPGAVAADRDGNVFVADTYNHRVRRVSAIDATITTVAGGGSSLAVNVGSGTQAALSYPTDVKEGPDGALYIADSGNARIVRLDPTGTLTTVAGTGRVGFSADGRPALQTQLDHPNSIAFDRQGRLYISDSGNHRIRRVEADGTMSTVAGDGRPGFGGDGELAVNASLHFPEAITFTPAGDLVVADTFNNRVRLVRLRGPRLAGTQIPT